MYPKAALHLHQKVPGSVHWRVGPAGEPTLPLRTASGPQSHALRGRDNHFPEPPTTYPHRWVDEEMKKWLDGERDRWREIDG